MTTNLQNRWLRWSLEPSSGRWSLSPLLTDGPGINHASMGVAWAKGAARNAWSSILRGAEPELLPGPDVLGHPATGVRFRNKFARDSLTAEVDFALLRDRPLLLIRMRVALGAGTPIRLDRLGLLSSGQAHPRGVRQSWETPGSEVRDSGLRLSSDAHHARFFTNGWQSWSYAGSLGAGDRQPHTRLGLLSRPIFNNPSTGLPTAPGHFVSDMFGVVVDRKARSGLLAGFVTQNQAFGSLEVFLGSTPPGMRLWASGDGCRLEPGKSFETDWAAVGWLNLDDVSPLDAYLDLAAESSGARVPESRPVGWSSWYYFFESVSSHAVDANLAWLADQSQRLPFELVQLDDGFQADVGDWYRFHDGFDGGVQPLSQRIADAGMTPGLWLAPFIAKPRSKWVRDHPEWVLRRAGGRPANAGYNWSTFTVGLDPTHPGVETAVAELVDTAVRQWGFTFLKLDFLYAAALPGRRYDPASTRAQAMGKALSTIREAAGEETWLMGCGCPLGSGIGVFDSMRVGPDVAPRWKPAYQGIELFFHREPGLPSARNGLQMAMNRSMVNGRWWLNDPDCLILRDSDTHLSADETQTLASVMAMIGGSLIDSDDLPALAPERVAWLSRLLPPLPHAAHVHSVLERDLPDVLSMDLDGPVGSWKLVALVNWGGQQRQMELSPEAVDWEPSHRWGGVDFWRGQPVGFSEPPWTFDVPAHGVRLFSLRRMDDSTPVWLGDTLHVSQGLAVARWAPASGSLTATISPGHNVHGAVWLALPGQPFAATLGGSTVDFQPADPGVFAAELAVEGETELAVRWTESGEGKGAD